MSSFQSCRQCREPNLRSERHRAISHQVPALTMWCWRRRLSVVSLCRRSPFKRAPCAAEKPYHTASDQMETVVLELRPTCENCNKPLPPNSTEARICSYECTFCASCVDTILENVCSNCGGGFVPRPIRPSTNWKNENCLRTHPASIAVRYRPVDLVEHALIVSAQRGLPPEQR